MTVIHLKVVSKDKPVDNQACNRLGYTLQVTEENRMYFGFEDRIKPTFVSKFVIYKLSEVAKSVLTDPSSSVVLETVDMFGNYQSLRFKSKRLEYLGGDEEYLLVVSDQHWLDSDIVYGKQFKINLKQQEEEKKKKEEEEVLKDSEVFDNLINITKNANEQVAEANKEIATLTEANEQLSKELEQLKRELNAFNPDIVEVPTDIVHFQLCGLIHSWNNSLYRYLSSPSGISAPEHFNELFMLQSYGSSCQMRFSCVIGEERKHFKSETVYMNAEFVLLENGELYKSRLHAISELQQQQHSRWFKKKNGIPFKCPEFMRLRVWLGSRFVPVTDFLVDEADSSFGIKNAVLLPYGLVAKSILMEKAKDDPKQE